MFPDELVILSLFLLPPSKGPKGGILEYLAEQGLVCSNVHGNHHRRILLTEVLTPWFCNLRFFTSSVLLFGADVSGVWKEDLWHHLTLRRGNNHRHGFFNPPLKWIPGYWKPWSHSFKLPITEPLLQALQRILSSSFCEKEGRGDYCWFIEGKWSEQSRWDSHLLWEESLEANLPRLWELIKVRTPDWVEMAAVWQQ